MKDEKKEKHLSNSSLNFNLIQLIVLSFWRRCWCWYRYAFNFFFNLFWHHSFIFDWSRNDRVGRDKNNKICKFRNQQIKPALPETFFNIPKSEISLFMNVPGNFDVSINLQLKKIFPGRTRESEVWHESRLLWFRENCKSDLYFLLCWFLFLQVSRSFHVKKSSIYQFQDLYQWSAGILPKHENSENCMKLNRLSPRRRQAKTHN